MTAKIAVWDSHDWRRRELVLNLGFPLTQHTCQRCGRTFAAIEAFDDAWLRFWDEFQSGHYDPRAYILENLTLEKCAQHYLRQAQSVFGG